MRLALQKTRVMNVSRETRKNEINVSRETWVIQITWPKKTLCK